MTSDAVTSKHRKDVKRKKKRKHNASRESLTQTCFHDYNRGIVLMTTFVVFEGEEVEYLVRQQTTSDQSQHEATSKEHDQYVLRKLFKKSSGSTLTLNSSIKNVERIVSLECTCTLRSSQCSASRRHHAVITSGLRTS